MLEFDPPIAGQGEWLNTSLYRFIPRAGLLPSTQYRVRIPAGLSSAADGVLESDFAWSFATIQPAISGFEPPDGSKFVEPDGPFVVTFNQPMERASVEAGLVLREDGGPDVAASFAWSEGDTVVTLTPAEPLALGTVRSLIAPAGLRGASAGAMPSNRSSRFTVVEQPKLVRTNPPEGSTSAWPYNIELYYNNPMDIASFEDRITDQRHRPRTTSHCAGMTGAPRQSVSVSSSSIRPSTPCA